MKKSALRAAILQELQTQLMTLTRAAEMARDEAISEESRAENKWDTHSQEAAYLAEGQARLAADLHSSIDIYTTLPLPDFSAGEPIAIGALVTLRSSGGTESHFFLGPRNGGIELQVEAQSVLVLTPQSPLGRQLLGRRCGEPIETPGRGRTVRQEIVAVR